MQTEQPYKLVEYASWDVEREFTLTGDPPIKPEDALAQALETIFDGSFGGPPTDRNWYVYVRWATEIEARGTTQKE